MSGRPSLWKGVVEGVVEVGAEAWVVERVVGEQHM
jgi:hypothetical protein